MATLKNTSINDTGALTLPTNASKNATSRGNLTFDPNTNGPKVYDTKNGNTFQPAVQPYLTRQIITTGYLHGGYASSSVWNNTNRITFSTDTTINLGDNTQEVGHNYQCGAFSRNRMFTFGAGGGHCVAASNVICFDMRTEQAVTSGYTRSWPFAHVNGGVVQQEQNLAYMTSGYNSASIHEWNLITETLGSQYGTSGGGGQIWGTWHENYGIFYGGAHRNFHFATRTNVARPGTAPAGDGYQHGLIFKRDYQYAGREGNPSTNWRKTNMIVNTSWDAVGAKPYYSGEENSFAGQDWGYCVGWYQGSHVNTAFKFIYATETGSGTTSSLEAKGKAGNSSATMSWRD